MKEHAYTFIGCVKTDHNVAYQLPFSRFLSGGVKRLVCVCGGGSQL